MHCLCFTSAIGETFFLEKDKTVKAPSQCFSDMTLLRYMRTVRDVTISGCDSLCTAPHPLPDGREWLYMDKPWQ